MDNLKKKQQEFNKALNLYHKKFFYRNFNKVVSFIILFLQIISIIPLFHMKLNFFLGIFSFFLAYLCADFINGLIHMYMDNNNHYSWIFGPFIAAFHLHHKTTRYKNKNILSVYYNESGSKYWLIPYYIIIIILEYKNLINVNLYLFFIFIALLSSIAEVSHFLCHNSTSKTVLFLQKIKILLPRKHHFLHHRKDNINYAFLNGVTDPLINFIAKKIYNGYKNSTDKHFER